MQVVRCWLEASDEFDSVGSAVKDFVAPVAGTYFVTVAAASLTDFSLLVTRGSTFDLATDSANQEIGVTGQVFANTRNIPFGSDGNPQVGISLPQNQTDGDGFFWDFNADGSVADGSADAFDGGFDLSGFPSFFSGFAEESSRELVFGPQVDGDIEVTRKIYVSDTAGFARYLEVVTNTGSTPESRTIAINTFGPDGSAVATSSNDLITSPADNWIVVDDFNPTGTDEAVAVIVGNEGGQDPDTFQSFFGSLNYSFNLELEPGETKIVMHFGVQDSIQSGAIASAQDIEALRNGALIGMTQEEIDSVVNWVVPKPDEFSFEVTAATTLSLSTITPADGTGLPENTLDPSIELYDPSGNLVAMDDNGAADGRNALLSAAVTELGVYRAVVNTTSTETGAYSLQVTGTSTGDVVSSGLFEGTGVDPGEGSAQIAIPTTYEIDFSEGVLLSSVDGSELTLTEPGGGFVVSTSATVVDGNTLIFNLPTLIGGDGVYTASISAGDIASVSGGPLEAFTGTFIVDASNPSVTSISAGGTAFVDGDTVASDGGLSIEIQFSEELASLGLGAEDVTLTNTATSDTFVADSFVYDSTTSTLSLGFDSVPESNYNLSLVSGTDAFRDLVDNPLTAFSIGFTLDIDVAPITQLNPKLPFGSLIHDPPVGGVFDVAGDVDSFGLDLDSNQVLTVVVTAQTGDSQIQIDVLDNSSASIATATASAASENVILQAAPITAAGTYTVQLTNLTGTGTYEVEFILNAIAEEEGVLSGSPNNTIVNAQDLASSSVDLPGSGDRLAALGTVGTDVDLYRFSLAADEFASIAVTAQDTSSNLDIALLDAAGNELAAGIPVNENITESIDAFVAGSTADFFVEISGDAGTDYSLLVTRNAQYDIEDNNTPVDGQTLLMRDVGGGVFEGQALGGREISALLVDPDDFAPGTNLTNAFAGVTLSVVSSNGVTPTGETIQSLTSTLASTGSRVFGRNGNNFFNSSSNWFRADFAEPVDKVSIDIIGDDGSDPGILRALAADGTVLEEALGAIVPTGTPANVDNRATYGRYRRDFGCRSRW